MKNSENKSGGNSYKTNVINVNAALKVEKSTFAGALKSLNALLPVDAPKGVVAAVKSALKDEAKFAALKNATRKSKAGNVSPFYILQAIYKMGKK